MNKIAYIIPIVLISTKMMAEGYGGIGFIFLLGGILLVNLWPSLDKKFENYYGYWRERDKEDEKKWKDKRRKYLQEAWRGVYSIFKKK